MREAKEVFQKAIQNPIYRTPDAAHFNLGLVHLELKDVEQAKKAFLDATRINPGYPDARLRLAELQYETGECKEVETGLREFLRFRPEFPVPTRPTISSECAILRVGRARRPALRWNKRSNSNRPLRKPPKPAGF